MNENVAVTEIYVHSSFPGGTGQGEEEPGQGSASVHREKPNTAAGWEWVKT